MEYSFSKDLNTWEFQKKINSSVVVRRLFFTSFTTVVSLILVRSSSVSDLLVGQNGQVLVFYPLLIKSLIIFFLSSLVWSIASLIFSFKVPNEVNAYEDIYDYLSKQRILWDIGLDDGVDVQKDKKNELQKILDEKRNYWDKVNLERSVYFRIVIFIIQSIAVIVYGFGVWLFYLGVQELLYEIFLYS